MVVQRFTGSNIVGSVSGQQEPAPVPVATPPPPGIPPFGPGLPPYTIPQDEDTTPLRPPQEWAPRMGDPQIGDWVVDQDETGRRTVRTYMGEPNPIFGIEGGWQTTDRFFAPTGGAGSDPAFLAETVRSNLAREAEARRRRALDAASNAASAFLTGTQLSDARRLNAFQESRALLPFLVDPEQQFFSGLEPGGLVQSGLERIGAGRGFQPTEIQHKQLTPAQLAIPPAGEQVGSAIVESIGDISTAGAA